LIETPDGSRVRVAEVKEKAVPRRLGKTPKESVVETRKEESESVSLDDDDNRERKIIRYLGPAPLLYEENENDYKEIANLVRKQLIPNKHTGGGLG
jgi:hypothetical protein